MTDTDDFQIGEPVDYSPADGVPPERGVVTSVNDRYVFVRYGRDVTPKATSPENLEKVR
jgi:hypothetical protein